MKNPRTLFLDIETSGLVPQIQVPGKRPNTTKKEQLPYETGFMDYPYIVSMAWKINDEETRYYVINQEGREIPKEASDIHGITTEITDGFEEIFEDIILQFERDVDYSDIVVGHGLYFDTSIIKANVLRCKLDKEIVELISHILHKYKRIDTMRSTAKMMRKWPTLQELHMKIFHKGFDAHVAYNDVEALYRCYGWLVKKGIVPTLEKLKERAAEKEANA